MGDFKGSKGPWMISDGIEKWNRIVDASGDLVTTCYAMQREDDANANLIAAAPELLEALQLLISEQSGGDKSCGHNGFTCTCPYDKAKAAIKKALGQ